MSTQQYDNTNKGALFKNDDKRNDKDPDYKGTVNVDGREFWISGWIRTPRDTTKKKFIGFSIKPKDDRPPAPVARAKPEPAEFERDDVPF